MPAVAPSHTARIFPRRCRKRNWPEFLPRRCPRLRPQPLCLFAPCRYGQTVRHVRGPEASRRGEAAQKLK
eukprot:10444920-Heterocapsa_arctica.AAC.1